MNDTIDAYIDQNRDRFVAELKELLRFPSVSAQESHDKDTVACAKWVQAHLAALGGFRGRGNIADQSIVARFRRQNPMPFASKYHTHVIVCVY